MSDASEWKALYQILETTRRQDPQYVDTLYRKLNMQTKSTEYLSEDANDWMDSTIQEDYIVDNTNFGTSILWDELKELDKAWTPPSLDKQLHLLESAQHNFVNLRQKKHLHLDEMVPKLENQSEKVETISTNQQQQSQLPLTSQFGIKMFFKLLRSVRQRSLATGNYGTLSKVIRQLPLLVSTLPSLALNASPATYPEGIVEELVDSLQKYISISPPAISVEDYYSALTSLLGISLKFGILRHILTSVKVLLIDTKHAPQSLEFASNLIGELVEAKAKIPDTVTTKDRCSGMLMSFGKGDHGKLGHGSCSHASCIDSNCTENKLTPQVIESIRDVGIVKIDSLSTHSVALTTKGELLTWGNGDKHRLGHGITAKEYAPRSVIAFKNKSIVVDVACGLGHTIALLENGQVYAWGNGGNGRLGLGENTDRGNPMHVEALDTCEIAKVFAGASHSLATSRSGIAYAWGKNNQGQCGLGTTNDQLTPEEISFFSSEPNCTIVQMCGGWEHSLALSSVGKTYSFGSGYKDSRRPGVPPVLGHGSLERQIFPLQISALAHEKISHIACGWDHSMAVAANGGLYTWGSGTNGKLGHGDEINCLIPKKVQALESMKVIQVEAGCEHTAALTQDGKMYTWGHGDSGRLGVGSTASSSKPLHVQSLQWENLSAISIAVGDKYNLVLVRPQDETAAEPIELDCGANEFVVSNLISTSAKSFDFDGSWILSRTSYGFDPSPTAAIGRTSTALCVLAQVERIAVSYLNGVKEGKAVSNQIPYAIDVSAETFVELAELLELFGIRGVSRRCVKEDTPKTIAQEAALADDISTPDDELKKSKVSAEIVRFGVLWTCLNLLRANLHCLLESQHVEATIERLSPQKTNSDPSSRISSAASSQLDCQNPISVDFPHLHQILQRLVDIPIFSPLDDYYESCGFQSVEEMKAAAERIQLAAAEVLKVGFHVFYPAEQDRRRLMWRMMNSSSINLTLLKVLTDRLSQNSVVMDYLMHVFDSASHSCISTLTAPSTPPAEEALEMGPDDFQSLMQELLQQCHERLSPNQPSIEDHESDPHFRLLIALQTHLLSMWAEDCEIKGWANMHSCLNQATLTYVTSLMKKSIVVLQQVETSDDKHQLIENIQQSYICTLLPNLMQSLCVAPGHPQYVVELFPLLIQQLKLLDKLCSGIEHSNLTPQLVIVEETCARLAGTFTNLLMSWKSFYQTPDSVLASKLLNPWFETYLLAGGMETNSGQGIEGELEKEVLKWRVHPRKLRMPETSNTSQKLSPKKRLSASNLHQPKESKADLMSFAADLFAHHGAAANFSHWMIERTLQRPGLQINVSMDDFSLTKSSAEQDKNLIGEVCTALVAVLLWHNGLLVETQKFVKCTPGAFEREKLSPNTAEPLAILSHVFTTALFLTSRFIHQLKDSNDKEPVRVSMRTVVKNCEFLIQIEPTTPVSLLETEINENEAVEMIENDIVKAWKDYSYQSMSKTLAEVSSKTNVTLETFFQLITTKTDLIKLRGELGKRTVWAQIRATALEMMLDLLHNVSLSSVKVQLTRCLAAVWKTESLPAQELPHVLDGILGCSAEAGYDVQLAFEDVYTYLAQLLEKNGTENVEIRRNVLQTWIVALHHVRLSLGQFQNPNSSPQPFDAFRTVSKSRIVSVLSHLLSGDADILSCLSSMESAEYEALTAEPSNGRVRVSQNKSGRRIEAMDRLLTRYGSSEHLHHLTWYVTHVLTVQLCNYASQNGLPSQRPTDPAHQDSLIEATEEIHMLLLTELSRVHNEFERAHESAKQIGDIIKNAVSKPIARANPIALTSGSSGKVFQEIGGDIVQGEASESFSVSFWLYLDEATTKDDSIHRTVLFTRTDLKADENPTEALHCPALFLKVSKDSVAIEYSISVSNGETTQWTYLTAESDGSLTPNRWYHVACTYEHSNRSMKLFIQGSMRSECQIGDQTQANRCLSVGGSSDPRLQSPDIHKHVVLKGVLDDVYWHESALTAQEVTVLAEAGSTAFRLKKRFYIDQYGHRLISLMSALCNTSTGSAVMSSSRWTSLLLNILRYAAPFSQRLILKMFRTLLPNVRPDILLAPILSSSMSKKSASSPVAAGSGLRAAAVGRGPHGVMDFLSGTFNEAWYPIEELSGAKRSYGIDRKATYFTLTQEIPLKKMEHLIESPRSIIAASNRTSLLSELVLLVRELARGEMWRKSMSTIFVNSIIRCPEFLVVNRNSIKSNGDSSIYDLKEIEYVFSELKEATCAIYALGGLVDSIRVGARVEMDMKDAMFTTSIQVGKAEGIVTEYQVVDKQAVVRLLDPATDHALFPLSALKVVKTDAVSTAECITLTDVLHPTIEFFLTQTPCLDGHREIDPSVVLSEEKEEAATEVKIDTQIAVFAHLRSRFFRSLSPIVRASNASATSFLSGGFFPQLLALASTDTCAASIAALGTDAGNASNLPTVEALCESFRESVSIEELEALSVQLWSRITISRCSCPWWMVRRQQKLEILGGEAEIDEFRVKAIDHFPTVRLSGVSMTAKSGAWFYEVVLLSDGLMQIGWADSSFTSDALQGHGVGDHERSYAYDGFRRKKWNGTSGDYGERWQAGDVVGVLLDTDASEIRYYLNGRELGVAFAGMVVNGLYPAASLNAGQSVHYNFGGTIPFMHPPANIVSDVKPVAKAGSLPPNRVSSLSNASNLDSTAGLLHVPQRNVPTENSTETESRRNRMIENLIGMGFPVEWALRCARESPPDMNESGAIAWIIEQMEQEAYKLDDTSFADSTSGFLDSFTESTIEQGEQSEIMTRRASFKLALQTATIGDDLVMEQSNLSGSNPYLTSQECDHIYAENYFESKSLTEESDNNNESKQGLIHLADTAQDEELWACYVTTENALAILHARNVVSALLESAAVSQLSESIIQSKTQILQLVDFMKLSVFRGNSQQCSTISEPFTGQSGVILPCSNATQANLLQQSIYNLMSHSNAMMILTEEIVNQFKIARAKEHLRLAWGTGRLSSKSSSDHGALIRPNLEWAMWAADTVLTFSQKQVQSDIESKSVGQHQPIYALELVSSFLHTAVFPNVAVRHYAFTIASRILCALCEHLESLIGMYGKEKAVEKVQEWYNAAPSQYVSAIPFENLIQLFSIRYRTENANRIIHSAYVQSLLTLILSATRLEKILNPSIETTEADEIDDTIPKLLVEEISSNSISLSWNSRLLNEEEIGTATYVLQVAKEPSFIYEVASRMPVGNHGLHTVNSVESDTSYKFRLRKLGDSPTTIDELDDAELSIQSFGPELSVTTSQQPVFMIDAEATGENLQLSNNGFTVKNTVNKRWNAARATTSYSYGSHYWEVQIDKCVSKNIFIGVVEAEANMENYVGSDRFGWGYLANKAVWHNRGKLRSYGELYKEGDTIGITLDMDIGTLSFSRNGRDLGVAVDGLVGELCPAFSLYNKDDQVTLIPSQSVAQSGSGETSGGCALSRAIISDMVKSLELLRSVFEGWNPAELLKEVYEKWCQWKNDTIERRLTFQNEYIDIDVAEKSCQVFGYNPGDAIFSGKGTVTVVGCANHLLWYQTDGSDVVSPWSLRTCREMKQRPGEYPVTPRKNKARETEASEVTLEAFIELNQHWNNPLDSKLVHIMNLLSDIMGYDSPWNIRYVDLNHETIRDMIGDAIDLSFLDSINPQALRARIGLIRYYNDLMIRLLPLVDYGAHSADWHISNLITKHRGLIFSSIKAPLLHRILNQSSTPTRSNLDGYDDPPEMPRVTICSPETLTVDDPLQLYRTTYFFQIFHQIHDIDPKELRRHFVGRHPFFEEAQERTLSIEKTQQANETIDMKDPQAQSDVYKEVFRQMGKEIQDADRGLFDQGHFFNYNGADSIRKALSLPLYRFCGQVLGMALRGKVNLPLRLSLSIWKLLTGDRLTLEDLRSIDPTCWNYLKQLKTLIKAPKDDTLAILRSLNLNFVAYSSNGQAVALKPNGKILSVDSMEALAEYTQLLETYRLTEYAAESQSLVSGFNSIIPKQILPLVSPEELATWLSVPYMIHIDRLKDCIEYHEDIDPSTPYILDFWSVLESFAADERRLFVRFICDKSYLPNQQSFRLVIRPPLSNAQNDPDKSYPIMEKDIDVSYLYLPIYTSKETMFKRLLVAISNCQLLTAENN